MPRTLPLFLFFLSLFCQWTGCVSPTSAQQDTGGDRTADTVTQPDTASDTARNCDGQDARIIASGVSAAIPTVGIVEWESGSAITGAAYIEFGPNRDYGHFAPVETAGPRFRTLLLGMKPSAEVHFRIVVNGCPGADHAMETGAEPTDLPPIAVTAIDDADAAAGGFIVTTTGMKRNYAYILDGDGDIVWWFSIVVEGGRMDGLSRAKMSADGRFMWVSTINVGCGCGYLFRIPMDGIGGQETIAVDVHHDFTVLPDNTVAYIEYTDHGDRIVERSDTGETRAVYRLDADFPEDKVIYSHCNALHFYPSDDSYSISCLGLNSIVKVDRATGSRLWTAAGDDSGDFSGTRWQRQHGHQLLADGNLLLFSNEGEQPASEGDPAAVNPPPFAVDHSEVLEISFDRETLHAATVLRYADGPVSLTLGDVQRLPNGNTLVTYSSAGTILELSAEGENVRSISADVLGYADWRPTLYGPPARY